jgi:hypothetical protein
MFKVSLPKNCPPFDSESQEMTLYRLFVPNDVIESFKSHRELFPADLKYALECKANGLSFFDNITAVKELLARENNSGKVIAEVKINKDLGLLTKKASKKGHFTLWLFKNANLSTVTYKILENV